VTTAQHEDQEGRDLAPFDFAAPLPPLNIRTVRPWDTEQTGTKP